MSERHEVNSKKYWLLVVVALLLLGVALVVSYQKNHQPFPPTQFMTPTEVTALLQQEVFEAGKGEKTYGRYYIENTEHQGDNRLIIVNSYNAAITKKLKTQVGKEVHLFGIRDGLDSHDFALMWLNGKTLLEETDAIPFFDSITFRQVFAHTSPEKRACLTEKLGEEKIAALTTNRAESLDATQQQAMNDCFKLPALPIPDPTSTTAESQ